MKSLTLDLADLRLLTDAFLAAFPPQAPEGDVAAPMDPLLNKILSQAQEQIEQPTYTLELTDEEAERLLGTLTGLLEESSEEGDLMLMGHLGDLISRLD